MVSHLDRRLLHWIGQSEMCGWALEATKAGNSGRRCANFWRIWKVASIDHRRLRWMWLQFILWSKFPVWWIKKFQSTDNQQTTKKIWRSTIFAIDKYETF